MLKHMTRRSFMEHTAMTAVGLGVSGIPGNFIPKVAIDSLLPRDGFMFWSFGGRSYSNPMAARSLDFRVGFKRFKLSRQKYSFRQEVLRACDRINDRRRGKPIGLCFSGGYDSEIVAVGLRERGVPFELYFLDFWGMNSETLKNLAAPAADRLGKKLNVVSIDKPIFDQFANERFLEFGCEGPTYLGLMYLMEQIPANRYIVVGDGDLDRRGSLIDKIGSMHSLSMAMTNRQMTVPFTWHSFVLEDWKHRRQKDGEMYFFRSTPELLASVVNDSRFSVNFPYADTRNLLRMSFPEVSTRQKTTNWDTIRAEAENRYIRVELARLARSTPEFAFWRNAFHASVNLSPLLTT